MLPSSFFSSISRAAMLITANTPLSSTCERPFFHVCQENGNQQEPAGEVATDVPMSSIKRKKKKIDPRIESIEDPANLCIDANGLRGGWSGSAQQFTFAFSAAGEKKNVFRQREVPLSIVFISTFHLFTRKPREGAKALNTHGPFPRRWLTHL